MWGGDRVEKSGEQMKGWDKVEKWRRQSSEQEANDSDWESQRGLIAPRQRAERRLAAKSRRTQILLFLLFYKYKIPNHQDQSGPTVLLHNGCRGSCWMKRVKNVTRWWGQKEIWLSYFLFLKWREKINIKKIQYSVWVTFHTTWRRSFNSNLSCTGEVHFCCLKPLSNQLTEYNVTIIASLLWYVFFFCHEWDVKDRGGNTFPTTFPPLQGKNLCDH